MTGMMTDADFTYFHLGPLGRMRKLPLLPLAGQTTASEVLIGGPFQGADGTVTLDVAGHRRTWALEWFCLTHADVAAVHSWYHGLTVAPLRIIDPRAGNRLTRDGASGGSYSRDVTAHTVSAGTRAFTAVADYPDDVAGLVDGAISWAVPSSTAATLAVDAELRVPLVPDETITVALLVAGTGSAQLGMRLYDRAGALDATEQAGSMTLGGWTWLAHTVTPASGQVSADLVLAAASGSARTVRVGPGLWHPTNVEWCPGHGCPVVVLPDMGTVYPGLANLNATLTVREV